MRRIYSLVDVEAHPSFHPHVGSGIYIRDRCICGTTPTIGGRQFERLPARSDALVVVRIQNSPSGPILGQRELETFKVDLANGEVMDKLGSRVEIVDLLGRETIRSVLTHYAGATGLEAAMRLWTARFADFGRADISSIASADPLLEADLDAHRIELVNAGPLCETIREKTELGNLHCHHSDARYCPEAWRLGRPVVYRCHAGLIDFVCPVSVGTHHVANLYGGQVILTVEGDRQDLRVHESLRQYVTTDRGCLERWFPSVWDDRSIPQVLGLSGPLRQLKQDLPSLAEGTAKKTPEELARSVQLLEDIADLLSARATERATLQVLHDVEEKRSGILGLRNGLDEYLRAAQRLVAFRKGVVVFGVEGKAVEIAASEGVDASERAAFQRSALLQEIVRSAATGKDLAGAVDEVAALLKEPDRKRCQLVPMHVGERCVGCWIVVLEAPEGLRQRARGLLDTFAVRAASFATAASEIEILSDVQQRIAGAATHSDNRKLPQAVTDGAARLYGTAEPAGLWTLDYGSWRLAHCEVDGDPFNGTEPLPIIDEQGQAASLWGKALIEGRAIWEGEIETSKLHKFPEVARSMGLKAVLSIPLSVGSRLVGVLSVHQKDPTPPTIHRRALLEAYGRSVAPAVQTWQLHKASQDLEECQHFDGIQEKFKKHAGELTGASFGCIWVYLEDIRRYSLEVVWGFDRETLESAPPRLDGTGTTEKLRRHREPLTAATVTQENTRDVIIEKRPEIRSWIGLPLVASDRFVGGFYLAYTEPREQGWDEAELLFLSSYAGSLAATVDRISRANALQWAELLATHGVTQTAARHAIASYLAAMDEYAVEVGQVHPELAERIRNCLVAIRAEDSRSRKDHVPDKNEPIELDRLIKEQWKEVSERSLYRYKVKDRGGWPEDPLRWPQLQLRYVIEIILVNTIQAMDRAVREGHVSASEIQVHLSARERGDNAWLYVWNSHPEFSAEDIVAINTGQRPPGARGQGVGLRLARAILGRAGGALRVSKPEPGIGALVALRIPMICPVGL